MSKAVKRMQMDAFKGAVGEARDFVFVNFTGLDAIAENKLRLELRKKGVRLHQVKNTLAKLVFQELGMTVEAPWGGATTVAWGMSSVADLSKEVEAFAKKHDKKVKVKGAVADGSEVSFEMALKMPTRTEAIGRVVMLALSPAARVAGALRGPAGIVAGQVKSISERKEEEGAEAPAPAATPA